MATCHRCGVEVAENAQVCPNCGSTLREGNPEEQPFRESEEPRLGEVMAVPKSARDMAILCHLSALAGFIIPLGNIVGPLLVWLLRREDSPYVDFHGKESLNFQISITIYMAISAVLMLVLIGFILLPLVGLLGLIMIIIAAVRANEGEEYRYPLSIRLIK